MTGGGGGWSSPEPDNAGGSRRWTTVLSRVVLSPVKGPLGMDWLMMLMQCPSPGRGASFHASSSLPLPTRDRVPLPAN